MFLTFKRSKFSCNINTGMCGHPTFVLICFIIALSSHLSMLGVSCNQIMLFFLQPLLIHQSRKKYYFSEFCDVFLWMYILKWYLLLLDSILPQSLIKQILSQWNYFNLVNTLFLTKSSIVCSPSIRNTFQKIYSACIYNFLN